ncbi:hypothetical protein AUQ48_13240 [Kocuria flava]|uniref:Uncharacterized protein n=1 Tax=Kocuria flava TaxID=446860 RepID=A0A2N4T457_9MICC|nr:hypothetical protein AUQ48_13240 [Kocuria flava]
MTNGPAERQWSPRAGASLGGAGSWCAGPPAAATRSPSRRRPAALEDLNRTMSPGASSWRRISSASSALATQVASLPHEPSSWAAS